MATCRKVYYCYKAVNRINGKVYVGFASDPRSRWREHKRDADKGRGYIFHDAIRKHGWGNFHFDVLCCGLDKREMLEYVEPALIEQYNSSIPNGYNMHRKVIGASGRDVDKRIRRKMTDEEKKHRKEMMADPAWRESLKVNHWSKSNPDAQRRHAMAMRAKLVLTPEGLERQRLARFGPQPIAVCPHCGLSGGIGGMKRWHFENCRKGVTCGTRCP